MAFIAASESLSEQLDRAKHAIGMPQEEADVAANAKKATWAAKKSFEVSKFEFKFPRARTFELLGLVLGCIEAKFCK